MPLQSFIELVQSSESREDVLRRLEDVQRALTQPTTRDLSRHTARGRNFYDRVIGEIIEGLRQAMSREALVASIMRSMGEDASADALGYVVLEADVLPTGQLSAVRVGGSERFNPRRVQNFVTRLGRQLATSHLVAGVLIDQEGVELLPTELTRGTLYQGEFDDLIDDHQRGAWISAIPLPNAEPSHPARMLVALYPVIGTATQPALPRGAQQEWRVLAFLRVAYELLNHQLSNVADRVALHRRDLIADLSPSIVNHEINQQLTILDEGFNVLNYSLRRIADKLTDDDPDLLFAAQGLTFSHSAINRLHRIGDAFNNLDRRSPNETVTMSSLLGEISTLAQPRLARAGVHTVTAGNGIDAKIRTDPALVEHVVLNVLLNAVDAIFQDTTGPVPRGSMRPKIRIDVDHVQDDLIIAISNNGPPIDLPRPQRIFERGVTTKPLGVGHGLGLHVCRLIMSYLGGAIDLAAPQDLPAGMSVGFRIHLPMESVEISDVLSSSSTSDRAPAKAKRSR